jgi:hypothetical protein
MSAAASPLRRFLVRRCSTTTMERLVDPILSDIQIEAAAAAAREQLWAGRWIWMAGTLALLKALVLHIWTHFWRIQHWPADDRRAVARTLAYSAAVTAAAIPLLMLPVFTRFPATRWTELAGYLIPQALPIAVPVGLFIGLIYGFRAQMVSVRPRAALVIAAIACSVSSLAVLAWLVPVSNQAFRVRSPGTPAFRRACKS